MVLVLLASGCVFDTSGIRFSGADAGTSGADAAEVDARAGEDAPVDARIADASRQDAASLPDALSLPDAAPPFCLADPDLVGCYLFDGDGVDGSSVGADATLTTVTFAGGVDGQAVVTHAGSLIRVAEHPGLDAQSLTLELWARPTSLPGTGARAGLIDNDGQYGLFIYTGGEVRCSCAGQSVSYSSIAADVWTHIGCTYDPVVGLILYVDGLSVATASGNGDPSTAGTGGLAIAGNSPAGDPLSGAIDNLRVWRRARDAGEMCVAAGGC